MTSKTGIELEVCSTGVVLFFVLSVFAGGTVVGPATGTTAPNRTASAGQAVQEQATCEFNEIYDERIASVVTVRVFDQGGDRGQGSGWVYAVNGSDALIVTNFHVVGGAAGADVRFSDGEWRNVQELVGVDPYADLAVLRVENISADLEALSVADSLPDQGDEVAALGSPLGLEGTITQGTVSAVNRSVTVETNGELYTIVDAIQVDTPISPGNSGGPLLNCQGEVVGVNFAGVSPLAGQNINFALSAVMVQRIVPALAANGSYNHSYMGIRAVSLSPTMARANGIDGTTQGVLVESVIAGGPAAEALQGSPATERVTAIPVGGDVIVAIDGTSIGDVDDLREYLFEQTRPRDTVTVTVLRDGERRAVELTLTARPFPRERSTTEEPTI